MLFVGPLFALFVLTFAVGFVAFVARFRAVRSRQMRLRDFEVLDLNTATPLVARTTRHLANLFEMPVLFYAVCLMALALQIDDGLAATLAWAYVALRGLHSVIHLTYNKVMHRMPVFMLSNAVLAALWLCVALSLWSR